MRLIHGDPAFWTPRGRVPSPHQLGPLEVDPLNPLSAGLLGFWLLGLNNGAGGAAGGAFRHWYSLSSPTLVGSDVAGTALTKGTSAVGPAAVFNGADNYFTSADADTALFNHPNITFCAGITCTTLVQFATIGAQWNETGDHRRWSLVINSTSGDLRADASSNGIADSATATTSTGAIAANRRHIVGVVVNGTGNSDVGAGVQIFVDGAVAGSLASYSSALSSQNENLTVGHAKQWGGAGNRYFTGNMDFTAMWSRPLTSREMHQFQVDPFAVLRPKTRLPMVSGFSAVAAASGAGAQSYVSIVT